MARGYDGPASDRPPGSRVAQRLRWLKNFGFRSHGVAAGLGGIAVARLQGSSAHDQFDARWRSACPLVHHVGQFRAHCHSPCYSGRPERDAGGPFCLDPNPKSGEPAGRSDSRVPDLLFVPSRQGRKWCNTCSTLAPHCGTFLTGMGTGSRRKPGSIVRILACHVSKEGLSFSITPAGISFNGALKWTIGKSARLGETGKGDGS